MRIPKSSNKGFTLIEVLVALVVLSIGLLGLAGLQAQGLSGNSDSLLRSQAALYVYDMIERMRINRDDATSSLKYYEIDFGDTPTSTSSLAQSDLTSWLDAVETLPQGEGDIHLSNTSAGTEATVSVRYVDKGGTKTVTVGTAL